VFASLDRSYCFSRSIVQAMVAMQEADSHKDAGFDVEAVIASFLADPGQASLPLPHMTTGQRRQVRKVVESNMELTCESYGFGADRQLHIFKKGADLAHASNSSAKKVNVKNTFIDDWITPDDAPERIVQTMPRDMFRQHVNEEAASAEAAEAKPATGLLLADLVGATCGGFLSFPPPPALQPMAFGLSTTAVAAPPPVMSAGAANTLPAGTQIMVEGLVKAPAFNGLVGVVQYFEEETARYSVLLNSPAAIGGVQQAKIKCDNLRLVAPPPYCAAGATESLLMPMPVGLATPLRLTALV